MKVHSRRLEARAVASKAYGRWLDIFQYLCPGMFNEAIANIGRHVRCPLHGGEKDFRFIKKTSNGKTTTAQTGVAMCTCGPFVDGFALLQRALGKGFYEVLCDVDNYLAGHQRAPKQPIYPSTSSKNGAVFSPPPDVRIKALWGAGKPITENNFSEYFVHRGIRPETLRRIDNLRFITRLGYFRPPAAGEDYPEKLGSWPAILGLLQDRQGNPAALHRTWLSDDRKDKAPVDCPKKLTHGLSTNGTAIRLFNAENSDTLGLCEGIETALAVRELLSSGVFGLGSPAEIPVWSCYCANNLKSFQIPDSLLKGKRLRRLVIFGDNDETETGLRAALSLKQRLALEHPHIEMIIKIPEVMGWDWLDFLASQRKT